MNSCHENHANVTQKRRAVRPVGHMRPEFTQWENANAATTSAEQV